MSQGFSFFGDGSDSAIADGHTSWTMTSRDGNANVVAGRGVFIFGGLKNNMKRTFTHCLAAMSVLIVLTSSSIASGQAKINMDDNRWVSVGGGLRTAF
ncbi:MAG TPA: hypothetical protein VFR18_12115, partial [Terriglobia bacterium]|nr:hypothetical protein [Terriglobia bacterium]